MNNTKQGIFITLFRILVKGKKHYIAPSINSIIKLLSERHDTTVNRRWIFQCLSWLSSEGYINRQKRWYRNGDGDWIQGPGLITITLKGARKLFDQGVAGAEQLCKDILGWLKKGDQRWPNYKKDLTESTIRHTEEGLLQVKQILLLPCFNKQRTVTP